MNLTITAKESRGEIWLYDAIGEDWFGGISANAFRKEFATLKAVATIDLHINSPGGNVFDGLAIYNVLAGSGKQIVVHIDGLAASIASVIAMSGSEIRMASNALMMIHDPSGFAMGDSAEMRKTADLLDQTKQNLVDTYAARVTLKPSAIADLMAEETWFDANQAKADGFVDVVTQAKDVNACFTALSRFAKTPKHLQNARPQRPLLDRARVRIEDMSRRLAVA